MSHTEAVIFAGVLYTILAGIILIGFYNWNRME